MANEITRVNDFELKNLVPAKVEAPGLDELVAHTDEMLKKYREFPIVDDTYDQAKQARKELRNTVESIAKTRKETEKVLIADWTIIKDKITSIEKSGKQADKLMTEQMQVIEESRKDKRRQVIENEVNKISTENGVNISRIVFNSKWVNVTYSHKDMVSEIEAQLVQIRKDDELRALQINQIEIAAQSLQVDPDPYVSMLGLRDLEDIKGQIQRDHDIKQARIAEAQRVQEEAIAKQKEREQNATKIGDKLIDEDGEIVEPLPPKTVTTLYIITAKTDKERDYIEKVLAANQVPYKTKKD
ncbi:DUF1351 domain-containing protein [Leuconostoc mesenteroides]|uniref:DUF1351 domain-containing protein n=1 Tax=Leuconostoc mesenteroides TaxID=1245 RepID=UPI0021A77B81|nr:DUF1351 domain-containing protein [Leuconostoc mesenteroides]MCT3053761.1 DUF1351 domain-containing protein [Leuconostoc mesenteroides]